MNDRIQELEKQCWSHRVDGTLVDGQLHFDTKKFAELIVRECAKALDDKLANPNGANMAYCDGSDLLEHFGVEQ